MQQLGLLRFFISTIKYSDKRLCSKNGSLISDCTYNIKNQIHISSAAIRLPSFVYEIKRRKIQKILQHGNHSHFIIDGIANYIHCKKMCNCT
jgi:hypothetical protein